MFTITADAILPSTVTGSWPRPRWFDVSMWGRPLDTCMLDVRFREKFQDAMAVVISDQERAGLDLLTHGDFHCDEDLAGRSWHHYPLQRWAGFEGEYLQPESTRAPWLHYPPGTLLSEIYTGWRWPHVVDRIEHRPLDYPKIWRVAQGKTAKPVRFGTCCSQVMALFLDPKAVASLRRDQAQLLTFYDFPAEHWRHLRTTNIIESPFATVRLRQRVTKGAGSRTKALMMAFKLLAMAEERWRKVNGSELCRWCAPACASSMACRRNRRPLLETRRRTPPNSRGRSTTFDNFSTASCRTASSRCAGSRLGP